MLYAISKLLKILKPIDVYNRQDHMKQVVQENYERIKAEAGRIVAEELERIKNEDVYKRQRQDNR